MHAHRTDGMIVLDRLWLYCPTCKQRTWHTTTAGCPECGVPEATICDVCAASAKELMQQERAKMFFREGR